MSEELTPLEVSKQLKDFVLKFVKNGLDRRLIHGSFDTIETSLKRLEIIDKLNEKHCEDMQKKLKALEIIKESIGLKMSIDENSGDEDTACLYIPLDKDNICIVGYVKGKEKIDLLKEVLYG